MAVYNLLSRFHRRLIKHIKRYFPREVIYRLSVRIVNGFLVRPKDKLVRREFLVNSSGSRAAPSTKNRANFALQGEVAKIPETIELLNPEFTDICLNHITERITDCGTMLDVAIEIYLGKTHSL